MYPQEVLLGWKAGWTQAPSDMWLSLKDGLPLLKAPRARADMQMWSSRRVRSHWGSRAVVFEAQAVMDVSACGHQLEGGGRSQKEKG